MTTAIATPKTTFNVDVITVISSAALIMTANNNTSAPIDDVIASTGFARGKVFALLNTAKTGGLGEYHKDSKSVTVTELGMTYVKPIDVQTSDIEQSDVIDMTGEMSEDVVDTHTINTTSETTSEQSVVSTTEVTTVETTVDTTVETTVEHSNSNGVDIPVITAANLTGAHAQFSEWLTNNSTKSNKDKIMYGVNALGLSPTVAVNMVTGVTQTATATTGRGRAANPNSKRGQFEAWMGNNKHLSRKDMIAYAVSVIGLTEQGAGTYIYDYNKKCKVLGVAGVSGEIKPHNPNSNIVTKIVRPS